MKNTTPLLTLLALWTNAAALTDDFERADTQPGLPPEEAIGAGYALHGSAASASASAYLDHGQVRFTLPPGTPRDPAGQSIVLHREDLTLGDTFRISGEVTAFDAEISTLLYGLAFNLQPDGRFYALRINTGKPENALQLVEYGVDGRARQIKKWAAPTAAEVAAGYTLTVMSVEPGVLEVSASGPGWGEDFGGEVRLEDPSLRGGTAGFYSTRPLKSLAFDNLTISPQSDEAD
jgi:hypothetical protein